MADCTQCGSGGAGRDLLCVRCRMTYWQKQRTKYVVTAPLRAELRAAYAGDRAHLSKSLDRLQTVTKWPRYAFKDEANRLGLTRGRGNRGWTEADDAELASKAGMMSVSAIARRLGRSRWSVVCRASTLELSLRVREGYNVSDLAEVFGVHRTRVRGWVTRGLLGRVRDWQGLRVNERGVAQFIRRYPHEYDLRRVDEVWFKAMVFGYRASATAGE